VSSSEKKRCHRDYFNLQGLLLRKDEEGRSIAFVVGEKGKKLRPKEKKQMILHVEDTKGKKERLVVQRESTEGVHTRRRRGESSSSRLEKGRELRKGNSRSRDRGDARNLNCRR